MWFLPRSSRPRDDKRSIPGLPDVCYDACNNAYLQAQSQGKVENLCDPNSAFNNYVQGCYKCIDTNGGDRSAVNSTIGQYLNFCNATGASTPSIDASWLTTYMTYVPSIVEAPSTLGGETITQTLFKQTTTFSTLPRYFFHLSVDSIVSSYIPAAVFSQLASSVSLSAAAAGVPGDATSLIYAALESTSVPPWFSAAVPATYSSQIYTLQEQINQLRATPISLVPPPTSTPTSGNVPLQTGASSTPPADSGAQRSKAWIAGPVVVGIAAIGLVVLGVIIYQRRRMRRAAAQPELEGDTFQKTGDKPQLHSDHLPPRYLYEMDASHAPSEADDGALPEMAANEVPAGELATGYHHSRDSDGDEDVEGPVASGEERENHQNAQGAVEARPLK